MNATLEILLVLKSVNIRFTIGIEFFFNKTINE